MPLIVQLRQRTTQYELLKHIPSYDWNDIREVACPRTNLFVPVVTAERRGWIKLGTENLYIDTSNNVSIPLDLAYRQGRIRLATPFPSRVPGSSTLDQPRILLIERIFFDWCKTQLVSLVDTKYGRILSSHEALARHILETEDNEIRFLDTANDKWISIEEGVGRNLIIVEPPETSADSSLTESVEAAECHVYHLEHVCPGGEPCAWLSPMEAARVGLFNLETGEVAADWPDKPLLNLNDTLTDILDDSFAPIQWYPFLTARSAGWLRLVEENDPSKWIATDCMPYQEPNTLLLSRELRLVAPVETMTGEEEEDLIVEEEEVVEDEFDVEHTPIVRKRDLSEAQTSDQSTAQTGDYTETHYYKRTRYIREQPSPFDRSPESRRMN